MRKGPFITFEGPEGSGKSTVIASLYKELEKQYSVHVTREPGGSVIAEQVRDVILNRDNTALNPRAEALLFAASRSQHYYEIIEPKLNEGTIILCDRFIDSSLAYQGVARGLGIEEVFQINQFGIGSHMPDLTIYIDVDIDEGLKRVFSKRDEKVDRLDLETKTFHETVREGYHELCVQFPERMVFIDGHQSIDQVKHDVIKVVTSFLEGYYGY
jgi:dTMP kinase